MKDGGEGGIRTLGTVNKSYNALAVRRFRPLSHLSARKSIIHNLALLLSLCAIIVERATRAIGPRADGEALLLVG